ncbi:MAG: GNAT family N-acetyltransferase [Candidatus Riflebacteria bacterium]|nr:GNAT family N-acetyltransferase [Candidatus Riflebacteria bacterium]
MPAQRDSADWNIARMVGSANSAKNNLNKIKADNSIFLVPDNEYSNFSEYTKKGSLLYFVSDKSNKSNTIKHEKVIMSYSIEVRQNQVFLIYQDLVVGYVKPIRESKNFIEVYIEIRPSHRGKGLAVCLLSTAVEYFSGQNKGVVYIVESTNLASINTVKKAGFKHTETICMFQVI